MGKSYILYLCKDAFDETNLINSLVKTYASKKYGILLIDVNHVMYPDHLLSLDEQALKKIYIFKPSSLEELSNFIDLLVFSKKPFAKRPFIIILNSLFIQITRVLWRAFRFDPLFILFGFKEMVERDLVDEVHIIINTLYEDLDRLPYSNIIKGLVDEAFLVESRGGEISIKTIFKGPPP